jgi:hypothetical protein
MDSLNARTKKQPVGGIGDRHVEEGICEKWCVGNGSPTACKIGCAFQMIPS